MRWYVAREGKTEGPISEEQMIADARAGRLAGTAVRDEQSAAWIPVTQSPFSQLSPAAPAPQQANTGAIVGLVIFLGCIGFLWYTCNSFDEHVAESKREQKAEQAAEQRAQRNAMKRYSATMATMTKDPPATLKDVQSVMGRKPDTCKRSDDQSMDACFWFLTSDSSLKVFSYTLAAENLAGSDPSKWVKAVVFARDGNVEKQIDGAIQQMLNAEEH